MATKKRTKKTTTTPYDVRKQKMLALVIDRDLGDRLDAAVLRSGKPSMRAFVTDMLTRYLKHGKRTAGARGGK